MAAMNKMNRNICLYLPSFFDIPAADRSYFSAVDLPLFFGRGERQRGVGASDWHDGLWQLMGLPESLDEDIPVAALRMLGAGEELEEGVYCCADPVHVSPSRDHLMMMGNETLDIGKQESLALAAELNQFFAEDNLDLTVLSSKHWVWHSKTMSALTTCALTDAVGRSIRECLSRGEQVNDWTKLVTEAQMLLHASDINQARQRHGQLEINSLWLWGMGKLPATRQGRFQHLYADDDFAAGLAEVSEASWKSLSMSRAEKVIADLDEGQNALLMMEFHANHNQTLHQQLQHLTDAWLLPLLQSLKNGEYQSLTLELGRGVSVSATAKNLRRFWRRRRSIESLTS
jgi:hypothetical protein